MWYEMKSLMSTVFVYIRLKLDFPHCLFNCQDDLSFDCLNIISGQIVTVQKLKHASDAFLDFNEIDLEVYCGSSQPSSATTCVMDEKAFVDYCHMRNTLVTGM